MLSVTVVKIQFVAIVLCVCVYILTIPNVHSLLHV